jgi:hypothetical protein
MVPVICGTRDLLGFGVEACGKGREKLEVA